MNVPFLMYFKYSICKGVQLLGGRIDFLFGLSIFRLI